MNRSFALLVPMLTSCLIAESPADFPEQPTERPTIVQSRVIPTTEKVLASFPTAGFVVPVKLLNPEQTFQWRVFVDFDPLSANSQDRPAAGGKSEAGKEDLAPADARNGIRRIEFDIAAPDDEVCHTIEFLVTSASFASNDARTIHNVDPLLSDQITWIYSPGGDLAGCKVQDAPIPPYDDPALTEEEPLEE